VLISGGQGVSPSVRANPSGAYVFTLPDAWTQKNGLRLKATLTPPLGAQECSTCESNNVFSVVGINFDPAIQLTIATVALTFVDPAGNLNSPPSPASALFADVFNISPVSPANATVLPYAGTIDVTDLVGPFGPDGMTALCRKDWTSICEARIYSRMRIWESQHPALDWVGLGAVDVGLTVSPIAIANSGDSLLSVGHEYYHDLSYYHASGACDANVFIDWPPDERGYIHGVGLDRRKKLDASGSWNGQYAIYMAGSPYMSPSPPAVDGQVYDLMSYCARQGIPWISVENWNAFGAALPNGLFPYLDAFSGTITTPMSGIGSAPLEANDPAADTAEMVEATALLGLDGHAEFLSVVPIRGKASRLRHAFTSTDYAFVARDAKGAALARVPGSYNITPVIIRTGGSLA
jgi:hypothetical protein